MAIAFDGTGGLFTRIGRVGKLLYLANQHQAALPAALDTLITEYDETTPPGLRDSIAATIANATGIIANQIAWMPLLQNLANSTLLRMVYADAPAAANSVGNALREVIAQMLAGPESVKASTVSVATAAATGNSSADGVVVGSAKLIDGKANEMLLPEVGRLVCTADSFRGQTTAGNEVFQYQGQPVTGNVYNYDWPTGSGETSSHTAASPATGSLLTNGDMETFATLANVPDSWTVAVGTPGTHILQNTGTYYDGASSVKLPGSATLASFYQAVDVLSSQHYAVGLRYYLSGVPAAGVLTIEMVDASGTVLTDDAGTNLRKQVTLSAAAGTTWLSLSDCFITPRSLPSEVRFRIRLSTALSTGTDLFVDRAIVAPMRRAYTGGTYLGLLSGRTPWALRDYFTVTGANNRGGASYNATFQALFDRLFNMRQLGLQLPSDASPSLADTLITA